MLSEAQGWGVDGRAILKTSDGGATWINVTPPNFPADFAFQGGAFLSAKTAWVPYGWICAKGYCQSASGVGGVLRTTDGGKTWKATAIGSPNGQPVITSSIDFINPDDGWLMAGHGGAAGSEAVDVYRTTDGGATWSRVSGASFTSNAPAGSLPVGGDKNGIVFADARTGWVTGDAPANGVADVYRTTDGGLTWHHQTLPSPAGEDLSKAELGVSLPQFFTSRDGVMIVNASQTIIYSTSDGGASWHPAVVVRHRSLANVQFVSPNVAWAFDPNMRVWVRTLDGGTTWGDVALPPAAAGGELDLVNPKVVFVWQGGGGGAFWRTTDGGHSWSRIAMALSSA